MTASPQALWVADAIRGDANAYGRLVRAHAPAVCAITLAITRDISSSEEVAQDVFLLAWTRLDQLENPDSFGPWLRQLSRNSSRQHLRSSSRRNRRTRLDNKAVEQAISPTDPVKLILDAEEQRVLAEAIEALPDDAREVLILYYREGQSVRQVAGLLGLSEAAVRKRLSRSRSRLRSDVVERFDMAVRSTIPGTALALAVLSRLSPRPIAGVAGTTLATGAAISVGAVVIAAVMGAALPSLTLPNSLGEAPITATTPLSSPPLSWEAPALPVEAAPPVAVGETPPLVPVQPAAQPSIRFDGDGHVYHPVFSVDGDYVAYEVNRLASKVDLYISRVRGSRTDDGVQVTLPGSGPFSEETIAANPVWHPAGLIVFEGSNGGGKYRLYYHQPGSGTAAEMITTQQAPGHITFPAVAADGSKMAMVAKMTGNGDLYLRDTNSGELTQETDTSGTESFPAFSPDSSEILFSRRHADTEDIFVKRFADGMEKMVTGGPGDQTRPVYAADGARIVYFDGAQGEGSWDLMSIDHNGGDAKRIGRDVRLPHRARPAISKDGEWVAFTSDDPQKGDRISVARVDGSKVVTVYTDHTACGEPALAENNGRVILAYTALPSSGSEWRFLKVVDITDRLQ